MIEGRGASADEGLAPAVGHPQFAMAGLLRRIGISRDEVEVLRHAVGARPRAAGVGGAASAAAPTAGRPSSPIRNSPKHEDRALAALSVIEAANADEEALAIAIALREAVEAPNNTAALVTPDRALARRVLAALERWQVPVDNSGRRCVAGDARPVPSRGSRWTPRSADWRRCRCWRCSSIRCPARRRCGRVYGGGRGARTRGVPGPRPDRQRGTGRCAPTFRVRPREGPAQGAIRPAPLRSASHADGLAARCGRGTGHGG